MADVVSFDSDHVDRRSTRFETQIADSAADSLLQ